MKLYTYEYLTNYVLQTKHKELEKVLAHIDALYEAYEVPKKNGTRKIHAIRNNLEGMELLRLQRNLYRRFLRYVPIAVNVKGFVEKESYLTFLKPHVGYTYFMRLDICDFFDSFSEEMMEDVLGEQITDNLALQQVIRLCTLEGKLPQGAVTSPAMSNICFRRVDQRILKYCQRIEERVRQEKKRKDVFCFPRICFTRYADDLLFSSNFFDFKKNLYFFHQISHILKENFFTLNRKKSLFGEGEIVLNGYVLGDGIHLSRKKLGELRQVLYFFKDSSKEEFVPDQGKFLDGRTLLKSMNSYLTQSRCSREPFTSPQQISDYLGGYRSFLISVLRENQRERAGALKETEKLLRRIEMVLDKMESLEV
ncbi:MAG: reverse transcriptase family protein [Roseburia sp. 1XD42-69]|jgi:Reverse transcriptase (RNA-dependent DNA polymerase).